METTTVYVFDHASGFDWNISHKEIIAEFRQYEDDSWLVECDGVYSVPVPIAFDGTNNEQITDYLEFENYEELGGTVLWYWPMNEPMPPTDDLYR